MTRLTTLSSQTGDRARLCLTVRERKRQVVHGAWKPGHHFMGMHVCCIRAHVGRQKSKGTGGKPAGKGKRQAVKGAREGAGTDAAELDLLMLNDQELKWGWEPSELV